MKMRLSSTGGVRALQLTGGLAVGMALLGFLGVGQEAEAQFLLGDASNYAVLYKGEGYNDFQVSNSTINGDVGIGDPSGSTTAQAQLSSGAINGNLNFAAAVNDSIGSPFTISGSITPKVTQVETDLNNLNSLSSTLAAESGTNLAINPGAGKTQTIDITAGKLVNGNYVFNVTTLNFNNNNDTLDIVGNPGTTQHVVFNIASANVNDPQFQGTINLLDGLTSNDVLFNITGSSNSNLQINGGTVKYGTFLDPNGTIGVGSGTVYGCVFGGGNNDFQVNSGATINCPEDIPENTPEPPAWTLGLCVAALLTVLRLRARLPRV